MLLQNAFTQIWRAENLSNISKFLSNFTIFFSPRSIISVFSKLVDYETLQIIISLHQINFQTCRNIWKNL